MWDLCGFFLFFSFFSFLFFSFLFFSFFFQRWVEVKRSQSLFSLCDLEKREKEKKKDLRYIKS